jgi:hypothetical protein
MASAAVGVVAKETGEAIRLSNDEEISIDRPMNTSANRSAPKQDNADLEHPGDMMARLTLDNGKPANGGADEDLNLSQADSLTSFPPEARSGDAEGLQKTESYATESAAQDGYICGISPFVTSPANQIQANPHSDPALESSHAPHALQTAAAANGPKEGKRADPVDLISGESGSGRVEDEEIPDDEEDDESSEISGSDEDGSWIAWFCSLRGNEYFCEVDEDYIQVRKMTWHKIIKAVKTREIVDAEVK